LAIPVTVPRLGWSMEEGTFLEWRKQPGDRVRPGEILYVLESDKAADEVMALDAGILHSPAGAPEPGQQVKVGQVLAYLLADGEEAPTPGDESSAAVVVRPVPVDLPAARAVPAGGRRADKAISPRARRAARELGIDWQGLQGSGRTGRIRERDVRAAAQGTDQGQLIPHTTGRRAIAARMVAGATQAAPVTLTMRVDATELVQLRSQLEKSAASPYGIEPSYTDLILKLTASALLEHPLLRAQWREEGLFVPNRVHIALAVDTRAGLFAPVIRNVDKLTLYQLAAISQVRIAQAEAGKLTAAEMRDGTFTVTNLGMFGVEAFTPIVPLPQCAVLGLGRIAREPAVRGDAIVPRDLLTLSLTFDHRVVDGAPAARFLASVRDRIEQPAAWIKP
jgi:pyruvate dehydrogenase E2 component (dihydrolipoamide acetyltransferase)